MSVMPQPQKHTQRGFTIVELLIVIVVIAILAAISIVAYNGIQSRARDAERGAEMNRLVKALEIYYIDNGEYPPCAGVDVCASVGYTANTNTLPVTPSLKPDPTSVNGTYGYYYARKHTKTATSSPTPSGDTKDYVLATRMENSGNTSVFSGWNNSNLNWYVSKDN